jgi:hypothetical protein
MIYETENIRDLPVAGCCLGWVDYMGGFAVSTQPTSDLSSLAAADREVIERHLAFAHNFVVDFGRPNQVVLTRPRRKANGAGWYPARRRDWRSCDGLLSGKEVD